MAENDLDLLNDLSRRVEQLERERALRLPPIITRAAHNLAGPWPQNQDVTIVYGRLVEVIVCVSAYSTSAGLLTAVPFEWDNVEAARSHLYMNFANQHLVYPTNFFLVQDVTPGVHTIRVEAVVGGTSDSGDFANILVRDYPR